MSKLENIKDAIQRHFSGENPPETMVANDAIQDYLLPIMYCLLVR